MGSSSDLASRMDFDLGLQFQDEVRQLFKSPVHHPHHSPTGSFFLLVTFRRHLFRLTEDSVSLALQSCLGGRALDFHVTFLSNNHFRFSVFSKQVGFHVYKLRRVITSTFDLYFHLWNNGTAHWEREKRAWEEEQEKEWTKVLSRRSKKEAAKASKSQKRVSFAKDLVHYSPPKHSLQLSISFGAFSTPINQSRNLVFGNTKIRNGEAHDRILRSACIQHPSCMQRLGEFEGTQHPPCMKRPGEISASVLEESLNQRRTMALFPNSKSTGSGPICSRCSNLGHFSSKCPSLIRCWKCLNWGHTKERCLSRTRPSWVWQPKFDCTKSFVTRTAPHLVWKPKIPKGKVNDLNLDLHPNPNQSAQQAQHGQQGPFQQQPGLPQNPQQDVDSMEVDEADNEWPAWNPAAFAADNGQVLPQHSLDCELDGIAADNDSSSSSDARLVEDRARFAAAQKRYANMLIFNRQGLPDDIFYKPASSQANDNFEPIVIDRAVLQPYLTLFPPTLAITGLEIVPWKPVLFALALQLWPTILASRRATRVQQSTSTVIILPSPRVEQVTATFSPSGFKFQSEQMQPSLFSLPEASSNMIMPIVESSVRRNTRICTSMSLPDAPSYSAIPLVDSSVRRSTRLSAKDGFHEVRLAGNPSKKRKTRPVLLVEPPGQTRPIPIEILQGWGIDCGVAPGELSQEALMQAPSSNPVANDEASI